VVGPVRSSGRRRAIRERVDQGLDAVEHLTASRQK
jgi:hypothetical protein